MSSLSPSDAAVAIRSFPRRFRDVLTPADSDGDDARPDADPEELARRAGPDGSSAVEHLLAADGVLALVDRALDQAVGHDRVELPETFDLAAVRPVDTRRPLPPLLEQLRSTAEACAERIDRVPTDEWGRRVDAEGQDTAPTLLELLQDGVDVVAGHLRAAERTIAAVT